MRWFVFLFLLLPLSVPAVPSADPALDASEFHEFLRDNLPAPLQDQVNLSMLHMLPDAPLRVLASASSIEEALRSVSGSSLGALIANTRITPAITLAAKQGRPLTIVVVPGLFAEFIPTRPFEEILSRSSADGDQFARQVRDAAARNDPQAFDETFDPSSLSVKTVPLTDVIAVGALSSAFPQAPVRLVLLQTPFGSGESIGSLSDSAAVFNRRLEKYLGLTGAQNLVFLGYSRGTPVALEMLARARDGQEPWLGSVRAMVSWAGVVWGTSLADNAEDPTTPAFRAVQEVKRLRAGLDPQSPEKTFAAWTDFAFAMGRLEHELFAGRAYPDPSVLRQAPTSIGLDGISLWQQIKKAAVVLGLTSPSRDFPKNVIRFQALLDRVLIAVNELGSKTRKQWWTSRTVPATPIYYSLTAVMADPARGGLDLEAFDGGWGYSRRSFDDLFLLQSRIDYEKLAVAVNDSQVSIPQATFLPKYAEALNPANRGMRSVLLGACGTHHWGMALQVVNEMRDGRRNPFPREIFLRSLADKISLDLQRSPSPKRFIKPLE